MGNDQLKVLVGGVLSLGELISGLADGVSFDDVGKLVSFARQVGPALNSAPAALTQYAAMSDAEALDVENFISKEFDISDDSIELVIEGALKVAIELRGLVKLLLPKS